MSRNYRHVLSLLYNRPLAIDPAKFMVIQRVVEDRIRNGKGLEWDDDERPSKGAAMRAGRPGDEPFDRVNDVAVIPIHGTITQRPSIMSSYSGGVSAEEIGRACDMAAADQSIRAIVLDIDSGGGEVTGLEPCAAKIAAASRTKQCIAVVNSFCASGAYWLASQASEIVCAPAGELGGIGVICGHLDQTKADEMAGQKVTLIFAGQYKAESYPQVPLSLDARAHLQDQVDKLYSRFVKAVADGRGTTLKDVRDNYGEGRTLLDTDAVAAGMADRVDTLEDVLSELLSGGTKGRGARSMSTAAMCALEKLQRRTAERRTTYGQNRDDERRQRELAAYFAERGLPLPSRN